MARLAVGHGVGAGQCESLGGMKVKRALPILPVARSMAILAVQAKLAIMMVAVAIDTTGANMAEDRLLVATDTLSDGMRPYQVVSGRGMIELE